MGNARLAAQHGVETEFQSCTGRVFPFIQVADGAYGQPSIGVLACFEFLGVKSSRVGRLVENGQRFTLPVLDIGDAFVVELPVVAFLFASFQQVFPELCRIDVGKDAVHAAADGTGIGQEDAVALVLLLGAADAVLLPRHIIHVDFVFGQGRGQHFPVVGQDIAACGRHDVVFLDKAVAHRHPEILLHGHGVEGLAENGQAGEHQDRGHEGVSFGHLFCWKIHAQFLFKRLLAPRSLPHILLRCGCATSGLAGWMVIHLLSDRTKGYWRSAGWCRPMFLQYSCGASFLSVGWSA